MSIYLGAPDLLMAECLDFPTVPRAQAYAERLYDRWAGAQAWAVINALVHSSGYISHDQVDVCALKRSDA